MYSSYYPTSSNELELTVIFITVFYIIAIISSIVSLILCGVMAARKERSVGGWIVGGLFLSWIAVIILACIPSNAIDYRGANSSSLVKKYLPYTCMNCKHTIDTRTCSICNYSNPDNLLKPIPQFNSSSSKATTSKNNKNSTVWYCKCGRANDLGTNECASCYARREL